MLDQNLKRPIQGSVVAGRPLIAGQTGESLETFCRPVTLRRPDIFWVVTAIVQLLLVGHRLYESKIRTVRLCGTQCVLRSEWMCREGLLSVGNKKSFFKFKKKNSKLPSAFVRWPGAGSKSESEADEEPNGADASAFRGKAACAIDRARQRGQTI